MTENEEPKQKRTVAIDSQILDNMESCYYKWYLYNLQNWRPKHKAKAFDKGWLVHEILRKYYQLQIDGADFNERLKGSMEYGYEKSAKVSLALEEITEVFNTTNEYFNFYRGDLWIPKAVEEPFSYKFYEDEDLIILYEGIVDLRVQTDFDENHPVDHKTTSKNDRIHDLKNQFIGYCRAWHSSRMTINRIGFQKTLPAHEKFTRHMKSYDKDLQEEWAEEVIHVVKLGIMHHDMGFFPRNFTSCDTKYGPCLFTEVCQTTSDAREWKLKVEYSKNEEGWDPLKRD